MCLFLYVGLAHFHFTLLGSHWLKLSADIARFAAHFICLGAGQSNVCTPIRIWRSARLISADWTRSTGDWKQCAWLLWKEAVLLILKKTFWFGRRVFVCRQASRFSWLPRITSPATWFLSAFSERNWAGFIRLSAQVSLRRSPS